MENKLILSVASESSNGKFRIAINFPDLSMMGKHSFMNIVGAPGNIENSLKAAAEGK